MLLSGWPVIGGVDGGAQPGTIEAGAHCDRPLSNTSPTEQLASTNCACRSITNPDRIAHIHTLDVLAGTNTLGHLLARLAHGRQHDALSDVADGAALCQVAIEQLPGRARRLHGHAQHALDERRLTVAQCEQLVGLAAQRLGAAGGRRLGHLLSRWSRGGDGAGALQTSNSVGDVTHLTQRHGLLRQAQRERRMERLARLRAELAHELTIDTAQVLLAAVARRLRRVGEAALASVLAVLAVLTRARLDVFAVVAGGCRWAGE